MTVWTADQLTEFLGSVNDDPLFALWWLAGINAVELTFVTNPHAVEVIIEVDKRGGTFTGGHDSFGRYSVAHTDADTVD